MATLAGSSYFHSGSFFLITVINYMYKGVIVEIWNFYNTYLCTATLKKWKLSWCLSWWHHQMEPSSALLVLCAVNSAVTTQRPVTRSFDVYFDLRLNKRLSKQSWGWWFETPSRSLWRRSNVMMMLWHRSDFYISGHSLVASNAELWCFLCWEHVQAVGKTI